MIIGIVLSITGIGAIIGIPLILIALGFAMMGGLAYSENKSYYKGECPYCGRLIKVNAQEAFNCPICEERIIVEENLLYTKIAYLDRHK